MLDARSPSNPRTHTSDDKCSHTPEHRFASNTSRSNFTRSLIFTRTPQLAPEVPRERHADRARQIRTGHDVGGGWRESRTERAPSSELRARSAARPTRRPHPPDQARARGGLWMRRVAPRPEPGTGAGREGRVSEVRPWKAEPSVRLISRPVSCPVRPERNAVAVTRMARRRLVSGPSGTRRRRSHPHSAPPSRARAVRNASHW